MDEKLFDYDFYINLYEDLKNLTKQEAYNHYLRSGKYENRICGNKNLYEIFDYDFYINLYDDIKTITSKNEAFKHFIINGINEERFINNEFTQKFDIFNSELYIHFYNLDTEIFNTKYKIFLHYLEYFDKNKNKNYDVHLFDNNFYTDYNNFDWEFYILLYDDLKNHHFNSKKKAYFHYMIFGKVENRIIDKNIEYKYKFNDNIYKVNYNNFNWESYVNNNNDILNINNKEAAFLHFIKYGINENRVYDEIFFNEVNKFDSYFYSSLYNLDNLSEEDIYNHWIDNKNKLKTERLKETKLNSLNPKNNVFITFIIPTIGRDTLIIAINSLFGLNFSNWNAIIIFDGVKKNININDERISIIELEKKEGITDKYNKAGYVRNIGFSYVKNSEWIGFLDDDDTLSFDYIEKLKNEIRSNNIDVCIFRMIYENNIILPGKIDKSINKNRVGISFALKSYITYNTKFSNSQHEDYFYLKELEYKNYKIVISPFVCYYIRMSQINGEDNSNKNNLERVLINFD